MDRQPYMHHKSFRKNSASEIKNIVYCKCQKHAARTHREFHQVDRVDCVTPHVSRVVDLRIVRYTNPRAPHISLSFLRRASPPLRSIFTPSLIPFPPLALCLATLQARHRNILCPLSLLQGTFKAGFTPCRCLASCGHMGFSLRWGGRAQTPSCPVLQPFLATAMLPLSFNIGRSPARVSQRPWFSGRLTVAQKARWCAQAFVVGGWTTVHLNPVHMLGPALWAHTDGTTSTSLPFICAPCVHVFQKPSSAGDRQQPE
jgi:hypothetical protein